ncbi:MAG: hypothetical protein J4F34_03365 [Gemmatimonadetes bacterium]|nr:hypothetical protein [Gemmatimonadota bacterium]
MPNDLFQVATERSVVAQSSGVRALAAVVVGTVLALLAAPESVSSQYRFGLSIGGASMIAAVVERRWDERGVEMQLGSWGTRDLSLSVSAKQYFGARAVRPFAGAGLWIAVARTDAGTGLGLVARAAAGAERSFASRHAPALTIYLNRALAVKRPSDRYSRPVRKGLVPIPELSYRLSAESSTAGG